MRAEFLSLRPTRRTKAFRQMSVKSILGFHGSVAYLMTATRRFEAVSQTSFSHRVQEHRAAGINHGRHAQYWQRVFE